VLTWNSTFREAHGSIRQREQHQRNSDGCKRLRYARARNASAHDSMRMAPAVSRCIIDSKLTMAPYAERYRKIFAGRNQDFPNLRVDRGGHDHVGKISIAGAFIPHFSSEPIEPAVASAQLCLGLSNPDGQFIRLLARAWAIVVGVADVLSASASLKLDLGGEDAMSNRSLGLGGNGCVPLRPLQHRADVHLMRYALIPRSPPH
jgi:hypothetical protein